MSSVVTQIWCIKLGSMVETIVNVLRESCKYIVWKGKGILFFFLSSNQQVARVNRSKIN